MPLDDTWLTEREADWARGMRFSKRLLEFRLARWCAKSAIAAAMPGPTAVGDVEIGHLPEGAPAGYVSGRPIPFRISMTDRADWAVCVVGPPGVEVGCDLELIEPRSSAFVADFFTSTERDLATVAGKADPLVANLIWSAKESALKVLRTGLRRDTRSVEVEFKPDDGTGWQPLVVRSTERGEYPGWWHRFGDFVLTMAASHPTSVPEALDSPAALVSAEPSHRWMADLYRAPCGGHGLESPRYR